MQDLIKKIQETSQDLYDYADRLDGNPKDFIALSQLFTLSEVLDSHIYKIKVFTPEINELTFDISQLYVLIVAEKEVITFKDPNPIYHIPVLVNLVTYFIRLIERLLRKLEEQ